MSKEKFINIHELQNETPKVVNDLKKGTNYILLRYSEPVGVLISYENYKKMASLESEFVEECKKCLTQIRHKSISTNKTRK